MTIEIGKVQSLRVDRILQHGAYLGEDPDTVLLPTKYIPQGTELDDYLDVFVYTDSEDRPVATTLTPNAVVGDFTCLTVKDVNDYGAFLDWGLDKDLFVPFREQKKDLEVGEKCVVYVRLDEITNRVIASTKVGSNFQQIPTSMKEGNEVSFLVLDFTDTGIKVIIDNAYPGMLYPSEVFEPLQIGDRGKAFVKRIREDGKLDLLMRKEGYTGAMTGAPAILQKLDEAGGFLPFNAKSSPKEIEKAFKMSKKVFKQIIGGLYKERKIIFTGEGMKRVK